MPPRATVKAIENRSYRTGVYFMDDNLFSLLVLASVQAFCAT